MKTTARLIAGLALAAFAAFGLSACTTTPAAAAPAPVATKATVDLLLEVRAKELELERTEQMAWLQYAAESGSDMVKGFVMGRSGGKAAGAAQSNTAQTIMQAQAQADNTALRREEMAERNGWFNKGMAVLDRGIAFATFSRGLGFQKFQIEQSNSQSRYTLDALRSTQQDGYNFNERVPYYFSLPMGSQPVVPVGAAPVATPAE